MEEKKTTMNGKPITEKELQEKIKQTKKKPGMKIVEKTPGNYLTKLED